MKNKIKSITTICLLTATIVSAAPNIKEYRHDICENFRGETFYSLKNIDRFKLHRVKDKDCTYIQGYCKLTKTEIMISDVFNGATPYCFIQQNNGAVETQNDWVYQEGNGYVGYNFYFGSGFFTIVKVDGEYSGCFSSF